VRDLLRGLVDLLLPPSCPLCAGAPGGGASSLCAACRRALPWAPARLPVPAGASALVAAVEFRAPVEAWVRRFKYPRPGLAGLDPGAAALLDALAREAGARAAGPRPDCVVPVPQHPGRLRARGFSPAREIAAAVARGAGAPLAARALRRTRDTPSQTGLARSARAHNVRGAFAATAGAPARVWLVDDVVTTGSTLAEAARALRRAGAREVVGVCVAWTPPS